MRKRVLYSLGTALLAVLVGLVVWQTSFTFGDFVPVTPEQTFALSAVSVLIFILTVTLGFMLARNFVKLYVDRHSNREGSRIRTKLVVGALVLTFTPVVFLVLFDFSVLNRNIHKWFTRPAEDIRLDLIELGNMIGSEAQRKAMAQAEWAAGLPQAKQPVAGSLQQSCTERGIAEIRVGAVHLCSGAATGGQYVRATSGDVEVTTAIPVDLAKTHADIDNAVRAYNRLHSDKHLVRRTYLQLLILITLFVLFVATWLALFMAKQISGPISALLGGSQEVRKGNLSYRVRVNAIDELAVLVRSFNEMTQELEANGRELDSRRRFTEAILESIPTGVVSVSADGRIQRVNRALKGLFSAEQVERATTLRDLFPTEDMAEITYLMNRARRVGAAASQLEMKRGKQVLHLSLTVAALEDPIKPGFVLVLEDTTDMLRAQKAAAWHEIARRIAHELKNPLTPIALCSQRIARQLDRPTSGDPSRILRECSQIISSEVETVRKLVDEFSQFARFPSARPVRCGLNDVVDNALAVFAGRLGGIDVTRDLAPGLPDVSIDPEQFKRMVVNLIDNAAEAMSASPFRRLYIGTHSPAADTVELTIADTGTGISSEDKEKLFLPYFTTKSRGTGLGLAIVNHIVSEHGAKIRVEDNLPVGARFTVELSALAPIEEQQTAEARA